MLKAARQCEVRGGVYKLLLSDELEELGKDMQVTYGDFYLDVIPRALSENPFCLPVMSYETSMFAIEKENRQEPCIAGLAITPTGDFENEYRRIGSFSILNPVGRA